MSNNTETVLAGIRSAVDTEEHIVVGTHIHFAFAHYSASGKTHIWLVREGVAGDGEILGAVMWFGRWRKYAFYPKASTVYEHVCLREVAEFCEQLTKKHRQNLHGVVPR